MFTGSMQQAFRTRTGAGVVLCMLLNARQLNQLVSGGVSSLTLLG